MVGRRSFPHISWVGVHPQQILYNRLGPFFHQLHWSLVEAPLDTYLAATEAMNEGIWIITAQPQERLVDLESKARTAVSEGLR